jgi:hypothetical protein
MRQSVANIPFHQGGSGLEQSAQYVLSGAYGEIRVIKPLAPAREEELNELLLFLLDAQQRQTDGKPSD